eukprot:1948521-Ditylum_brightwellii.AAC.1
MYEKYLDRAATFRSCGCSTSKCLTGDGEVETHHTTGTINTVSQARTPPIFIVHERTISAKDHLTWQIPGFFLRQIEPVSAKDATRVISRNYGRR